MLEQTLGAVGIPEHNSFYVLALGFLSVYFPRNTVKTKMFYYLRCV